MHCVVFICLFRDDEVFCSIRLTHLLVVGRPVFSSVSQLITAEVGTLPFKPFLCSTLLLACEQIH